MLREKAFDFWKTYIGLMTKGGVDVTMTCKLLEEKPGSDSRGGSP